MIFVYIAWILIVLDAFVQGSDLLNTRVLARLDELLPQQANSGKRLCHLENLSIR